MIINCKSNTRSNIFDLSSNLSRFQLFFALQNTKLVRGMGSFRLAQCAKVVKLLFWR